MRFSAMEKMFSEDSSVYVVSDDYDYDISILSPKIPQVSIDVYQPIRGHTWGSGKNFLMLAHNVSSLSSLLQNLAKSSVWNPNESALGRFLIVTMSQDIQRVFRLLWKFNIVNALVVVRGEDGYNVYSSDPFHPKNNCGNNVEKTVEQKCLSSVIEFPKPFRDLHGCPLAMPGSVISEYLSHALNIKIINTERLSKTDIEKLIQNNIPKLDVMYLNSTKYGNLGLSTEISRNYLVYVSPVDHNLFTLRAIAEMFEYGVWIAFLVVYLMTWLVWWVILRIRKSQHGSKIIDVFIYLWATTMCGCINRVPQIRLLRTIFLMHLFYVIIMQTAFNAKLLAAITSPTDSNKIEDIEDVANSKLDICDFHSVSLSIFKEKKPHDEIYTKIRNKLVRSSFKDHLSKFKEKQCIILIANVAKNFHYSEFDDAASTVIEDKYVKEVKLFLVPLQPHYIMSSINAAIEKWKESGIFEENMKRVLPKSTQHENDEPQILTLQHFSGVFALWGVCITLACVIFIAEIVVHKFLTK